MVYSEKWNHENNNDKLSKKECQDRLDTLMAFGIDPIFAEELDKRVCSVMNVRVDEILAIQEEIQEENIVYVNFENKSRQARSNMVRDFSEAA